MGRRESWGVVSELDKLLGQAFVLQMIPRGHSTCEFPFAPPCLWPKSFRKLYEITQIPDWRKRYHFFLLRWHCEREIILLSEIWVYCIAHAPFEKAKLKCTWSSTTVRDAWLVKIRPILCDLAA